MFTDYVSAQKQEAARQLLHYGLAMDIYRESGGTIKIHNVSFGEIKFMTESGIQPFTINVRSQDGENHYVVKSPIALKERGERHEIVSKKIPYILKALKNRGGVKAIIDKVEGAQLERFQDVALKEIYQVRSHRKIDRANYFTLNSAHETALMRNLYEEGYEIPQHMRNELHDKYKKWVGHSEGTTNLIQYLDNMPNKIGIEYRPNLGYRIGRYKLNNTRPDKTDYEYEIKMLDSLKYYRTLEDIPDEFGAKVRGLLGMFKSQWMSDVTDPKLMSEDGMIPIIDKYYPEYEAWLYCSRVLPNEESPQFLFISE